MNNYKSVTDKEWVTQALCAEIDPELFFPSHQEKWQNVQIARDICNRCPVRKPCLLEGMQNEFGIWGGWSADHRQQLKKKIAFLNTDARLAIIDYAAERGPVMLNERNQIYAITNNNDGGKSNR